MKGKWAAGIPPRNFTWVIKDRLAVSERPGGFAPNHRKVRRQEEIIWLQVHGFTRIFSLLPSSHNLQAYEERSMASVHFPLPSTGDARGVLADLYREVHARLTAGERILIHQEELGDRVTGVVAGYLLWSDRLPSGPQAITVLEHMTGHPMGPAGRELVAFAGQLDHDPVRPGAGGERASSRVIADIGPSSATGLPPAEAGDRIELRGLRVVGTHGVLSEEKVRAQPFEIDLDLAVDLTAASGSDRLSDTVDYAAVAGSAAAVVSGARSYALLEALADAVATAVLGVDQRIMGTTVSVRKLEPPMVVDIATVGVRITRVR